MAPIGATLLEGLGDYTFPVTSSHPEVQRWFDQGLMLTYGFNHDAAERTYLKATELDPDCAMCWWGAALVLGPHVNSGMDPASNQKAWQRLQRAIELAPRAADGHWRTLSGRVQGRIGNAAHPPEQREQQHQRCEHVDRALPHGSDIRPQEIDSDMRAAI